MQIVLHIYMYPDMYILYSTAVHVDMSSCLHIERLAHFAHFARIKVAFVLLSTEAYKLI